MTAIATLCLALLSMSSEATAHGTSPDETLAPDTTVPLTQDDLEEITLRVLEARPMVASSPGIKYAAAYRSYPPMDRASVIFYPHTDSGGVKQAFQVSCERTVPAGNWRCPAIGIRRYLNVESQQFETRVASPISSDVARTLIEATRPVAHAWGPRDSPPPDTAILVIYIEDFYLVSWGNPDGQERVSVQARLKAGGNPLDTASWQTEVLEQAE